MNFKKDMATLGILFVSFFVILMIVFYKDSLLTVLRLVASVFWLFVIPGFFVMYFWHDRLGFLERLLIGFALAAAVLGISSYYLGILGIHIKYHLFIVPPAMIVVGIFAIFRAQKNKK